MKTKQQPIEILESRKNEIRHLIFNGHKPTDIADRIGVDLDSLSKYLSNNISYFSIKSIGYDQKSNADIFVIEQQYDGIFKSVYHDFDNIKLRANNGHSFKKIAEDLQYACSGEYLRYVYLYIEFVKRTIEDNRYLCENMDTPFGFIILHHDDIRELVNDNISFDKINFILESQMESDILEKLYKDFEQICLLLGLNYSDVDNLCDFSKHYQTEEVDEFLSKKKEFHNKIVEYCEILFTLNSMFANDIFNGFREEQKKKYILELGNIIYDGYKNMTMDELLWKTIELHMSATQEIFLSINTKDIIEEIINKHSNTPLTADKIISELKEVITFINEYSEYNESDLEMAETLGDEFYKNINKI